MYFANPISGDSLPPMTLCLTYDDGPGATEGTDPGPHTLEIASFLQTRGVRATFFMCGKHAEQYLDLLPQIRDCGQLIGNHTYNHPNMVDFLAAGSDCIHEILRTDALIRNYVEGNTIYFRPPYVAWSPEVAAALNGNLFASLNHCGPVHTDFDTGDWWYWSNDKDPVECADDFIRMNAMDTGEKHGIMLMHDSSGDMVTTKNKNMTLQLTENLIPRLQDLGYQFVGLDAAPALAAQSPQICGLLASNGKYVSPQNGGGGQIKVDGPGFNAWEQITVEYVAPGKVALKASNGSYISPQYGGASEVMADGPQIGDWEPLDVIPISPTKVAFRTVTGDFLTLGQDDLLMADIHGITNESVFTFENHTQ